MFPKILFLFLIIILTGLFCGHEREHLAKVKTGLDNVSEYLYLFKDKRIGIVTNHTAYDSKGRFIIEVFAGMERMRVTAIFSPEHGIRGNVENGFAINSEYDTTWNIPIFSLYGENCKPTSEMLHNVDILVFDIQDIGIRFYTYIYTMSLSMEAAAEHAIPFVILDRPNPVNGITVEGNILKPDFSSFIGLYPIPVRYGMTVGELAQLINGEGWLANGVTADLKVIPMKNWKRTLWYNETGLNFIKTSPNIPDLETVIIYAGLGLLEGTNVSEGRGTKAPFKTFGAPWIEGKQLATRLNTLNLAGISFHDTTFTPQVIAGMAGKPKYENRPCSGILVELKNRNIFKPYSSGIYIIKTIYQLYQDSLSWRESHFDQLCGTEEVRRTIQSKADLDSLFLSWQNEMKNFLQCREKYLIYN
jgi:uncharacterized protein YbbC (DUF1343 family)